MTHQPVAIVFNRFGPYHCARVNAVTAQCPAVGIEVVRKDDTYKWDVVERDASANRVTLFPEITSGQPVLTELRTRLHRALERLQPRVVAIPGWEADYALLALEWCLRTSTPAVLMSESTAADKPRTTIVESVKRRLLRLYSAALVGGTRHAAYLTTLGFRGEAVFYGYDTVDNRHFEPSPGSESTAPARAFLVSCRFVAEKNLGSLLRAYAGYRHAAGHAAWRLTLAGDGPELPSILETIRALSLESSVQLLGFVQYRQLRAMYQQAHAFILPSLSEPWGLVINEAMAAGLPVLVSDRCGCAPELVREGANGFTFDPSNSDELTRLMLRVSSLSDESRTQMGQASREIIARWTPDTFAHSLVAAADCATTASPVSPNVMDKLLLSGLLLRHRIA